MAKTAFLLYAEQYLLWFFFRQEDICYAENNNKNVIMSGACQSQQVYLFSCRPIFCRNEG